jgi:hypothetical protein
VRKPSLFGVPRLSSLYLVGKSLRTTKKRRGGEIG